MQRSDREDGLDRWGEWIGGEWVCGSNVCGSEVRWVCGGQPVPENSPWVCVWLDNQSGWTGDRLAELDRVRWSGSVWVWALTHHGSAAFGSVIVWLSSAWPAWGRSVSMVGSEVWSAFFLSLARWLDRRLLSFFLSLSVSFAFFLSLSLSFAWPRNDLKWKWECKIISGSKA